MGGDRRMTRLANKVKSCKDTAFAKLWSLVDKDVQIWIRHHMKGWKLNNWQDVFHEAYQSSYVKSYDKLKEGQPDGSEKYKAYLREIVRTTTLDECKRDKSPPPPPPPPPPNGGRIGKEELDFIEHKIRTDPDLKPEAKKIAHLYLIEISPPREIAKIMGMTPKQISNKMNHFNRTKLLEYWREWEKIQQKGE